MGSHSEAEPMKTGRKTILLFAVAASAGLMLGGAAASAQQNPPALTQEQIKAILASPDRSAADRTNDLRRKPEEMLVFIGVRPGMTALDLSAAGGYTTELLARTIGPSGMVYGQSRPRNPGSAPTPPAAPEGNSHPNVTAGTAVASPTPPASASPASAPPASAPPASAPRPSPEALEARERALSNAAIQAAPIAAVVRPFEDPIPPELPAFDLVTLMFNYHDLGHLGVDRAAMNRAVFQALKRGGIYVIADHSGRPGTGISESGTLHRVEEAFVRKEIEAAGFQLAAEGKFLRNPNDPRDKNTPDPPQPKDEFVLKFVKP
jgi:predicted methyltransferase